MGLRIGWLAVILLGPPVDALAQDPGVRDMVAKYDKNIRAFEHCSCRFTLTEGHGTPSADLQDFKFTWRQKETIDCRYAVDGEFEAYEQFGTGRPDFGSSGPTGQVGTRIVTGTGVPLEKHIRGPRGLAVWSEVMNQLSLTGREIKTSEADFQTPLDLSFGHRRWYDPNQWISNTAYVSKSLGEKTILGKKCHGVRFVAAATDNLTHEVWFDAEIGMLPRLVDDFQSGKHQCRCLVIEAQKPGKSNWFPARLIQYYPSNTDGLARELVLKDLDLGRPSKKDLSITVPSGSGVKDQGTHHWFTLRQDETVSGTDLPELHEKVARAQTDKKMDTALTHKGDRNDFWFWACGGAGLLLVSYGAFRWFRTRSRAIPVA